MQTKKNKQKSYPVSTKTKMSASRSNPPDRRLSNAYFSYFEQTTPTQSTAKESNMQAEVSQQYSASAKQTAKSAEKQAKKGNSKQKPSRKSPTNTNEKEQASGKPNEIKKNTKIQTGLDRYINVKRKSSPIKNTNNKKVQLSGTNVKIQEPSNSNRFTLLSEDSVKGTTTVANAKPPPIYLRERVSSTLVNNITKIVGTNNFHVVPLKKGTIDETKIQIYNEKSFIQIVSFLSSNNKNYYSYQLKSSKGLTVVIKGIDSSVKSDEIKRLSKKMVSVLNRS